MPKREPTNGALSSHSAELARKNRLDILDAFGLQDGEVVRWLPNLRAGTAVFKLQRR